jgi:hypothetical protein
MVGGERVCMVMVTARGERELVVRLVVVVVSPLASCVMVVPNQYDCVVRSVVLVLLSWLVASLWFVLW